MATLNSLYIYDTESIPSIAVLAGLHYAAITDIAWSSDAKYLALSSQDCYCTLVEFENDELGSPIPIPETRKQPKEEETNVTSQKSEAATDVATPVVSDTVKRANNDEKQQVSESNKPAKRGITPMAID